MKLSNKFTFVRVIFAPVFFALYFIPVWTERFALITTALMIPLLLFAEFTDYLDGKTARTRGEVSDFGKLFDPFADVVLHLTILLCLTLTGNMPAVIFTLLFYREFSMNFLRMVAAKSGTAIAARKGGKLKTVLYIFSGFFALFLVLSERLGVNFSDSCAGVMKIVSLVLFILCAVASYASFADYLIHFLPELKKNIDF